MVKLWKESYIIFESEFHPPPHLPVSKIEQLINFHFGLSDFFTHLQFVKHKQARKQGRNEGETTHGLLKIETEHHR